MPALSPNDFDADMYAETKDLMGDGMTGLLERYFASTRDRLGQITAALQGSDAKTIGDLTHNIKSTSAGFGFLRAAALAKKMEEICRHEASPDMAVLAGLRAELEAAITATENAWRGGELN